MLLIAIPSFFFERDSNSTVTSDTIGIRTRDYITSRGLLVSVSFHYVILFFFTDIICSITPQSDLWLVSSLLCLCVVVNSWVQQKRLNELC
jgi:hypothetical protein